MKEDKITFVIIIILVFYQDEQIEAVAGVHT